MTTDLNKVSYAIRCNNLSQKWHVEHYFLTHNYQINTFHSNEDLSAFINPHDKQLLFSSNRNAQENNQDNGYIVINFELFASIILI